MAEPFDIVTGAFSFTGSYLARRLLAGGRNVVTLTGHPDRPHALNGRVPAYPFDFETPEHMERRMAGADTFYDTYWVRFEHGDRTYRETLERTRSLVRAAKRAGVRRLVFFSSTGADPESDLAYFRAKGQAERIVRECGLPTMIVRPTLLFGEGNTVFNNLAWIVRHTPFFGICGRGDYPVQPVHVDDLAATAIELARGGENALREVGGPATLAFRELVECVAEAVGRRVRFVEVKMERLMQMSRFLERLRGDVLLTREELEALARGMLVASGLPAGQMDIRSWLQDCGSELGRHYRSALERYEP
jgi:NADH dehydrogenase